MNPGEVVDERFEIERRITSGGMGLIYRALDRVTGLKVAFKLLHGHASERPARFQREAEALMALDHPSIVRYVAHGLTDKGVPWLAMDWLEGCTLGERIASGPLGVEESIEIAAGLAEALAVVHGAGLVHRDLKPSNIFLVDKKTTDVMLIDFGLVRGRRLSRTDLTAPGVVLGTVGYLAPEQARGESSIDARADVFAFGCVIFRCLTGKRPFVGDDDLSVLLKIIVEQPPRIRDLRSGVPPALDDLVARMLNKAPAARPADGAAVAAAIAAIGTGGPITTRSRRGEIGARERRVMALVLARDPGGGERPASEQTGRLHSTVERHRGQLELLADGSSLVIFTSDGEATDLAARAARCALSLRSLWPGVPLVVVSGRAEPMSETTAGRKGRAAGERLVGELIDRAVALLPGPTVEAALAAIPPGSSARVRVDEVSAGLLGPGFLLEPGGWLVGERESGDTPRTLLGKPTPCVGRDSELAALEDAYARSVEEPGANAVLVTAPAGVGKSRLRAELLRRLRARPDAPEIWMARGDPMSAGSSFALLGQALRRALGLAEGLTVEMRRRLLRDRVARGEPRPAEATRVAAFLGELLGTPFPDDVQLRAARRDPVLLGDQMRRAWEDFLRAETGRRPLVLVLEDLHWGDLPTVKFVDAALRHLETRPFLVLGLGRPEVHQTFPGLWSGRSVEEVHLGRLPRRSAENLVRNVLGAAVSSEAVTSLVERADGNALFLEELIRAVADGQTTALPETVLSIVQARLEALEGEERRVLRAASVFGQTFREDGVSSLLGGLRAHGWIRNLIDQEVIAPAGDAGFRFRHALVREAAYGMLTDADRILGHRLAGEWLESSGEGDAMVLAEHFERGLDYPRAAGFYQRASEHAFEGNDLEAALDRAGRGLRCVEDPKSLLAAELLLVRTKASRWRGLLQDAEDSALAAMRLFSPGGARWSEAVAEAVHAAGKLGHTDRLLACTEALLAAGDGETTLEIPVPADETGPRPRLLGDDPDPTGPTADRSGERPAKERTPRARPLPRVYADRETAASYAIALARAATNLQLSAGRQALVEVLLERADAAAEHAAGDPEVTGQVAWARSLRVLAGGDVSAFLGLVQASHASLEAAGDLRSACVQALNAGHGFVQLGLYADAARLLRATADRAERLGLGHARAYAKINLVPALAGLGHLADARAAAEDAIALLRAQADRPYEGTARAYLAMILALSGDRAAAASEAHAVADDKGHTPTFRALAHAVLAEIDLAEGRPAEALAAAEAALSLLTSRDGMEEGEALIRVVYAECLHAAGDADAARSALREARDALLARAAKIVDPAHRESFLTRVPENARTLARAAEWLDAT